MNDALFRYYRAFHYAADITRPNGGLRYLEAPEWDQAMPMLLRALTYSSTEEQTIEAARLSFARIAAQAEAVKRLRARGFTIGLHASLILIDEKELERLYSLVLSEAAARGGASLFNHLRLALESFWRPEFQRYVVNMHIHASPPKSQPSWPLGYLYNVAAKIASLGTGPGTATMGDLDYHQIAADICAVHAVEPYNWAEVTLQSGSNLIEFLGELGKFQFAFMLPQIDERDIASTLRGAFAWIDAGVESRLRWSLDQAILSCETLIRSLPAQGAVCIPKTTLKKLLTGMSPETLESLWSVFVHAPTTVNVPFADPVKASDANAYFKPLIGFADKAVVGLRSVSAAGWYEAVADALREAGISGVEQKIGDAFEPFVRDRLAAYGTAYFGTFSSPHGSGDVDAALATDSTILLFELKKKALTRSAQSGDIVGVLLDLIKSVVKAQSQLAKIEYVLQMDGSLTLGSSTLALQGRSVKRITLSWHDYGVFHDHGFLRNFLQKLAGSSISSTDPARGTEIAQINAQLLELAEWENKVASAVSGRRIAYNACFFYAIGHLLAITRSCRTDKQLAQHLTFNEHINSVALDFYVEYGRWVRDFLPHLKEST
jgi:hypothetical protein